MGMEKPHLSKNSTLLKSTVTAAMGLFHAVKTERKIRQVVVAGILVTAVCVVVKIGYFQTMMVIFSWVIALICEMFNTALEKALDYASGKEYHPLIRDGKDYASACTFIALVFAGSLAIFLIIDRLLTNLRSS